MHKPKTWRWQANGGRLADVGFLEIPEPEDVLCEICRKAGGCAHAVIEVRFGLVAIAELSIDGNVLQLRFAE